MILIDAFQEIRNLESEKLIKKNNSCVLVKIYILAKEWNLEKDNWLYITKSNYQAN